MRRVFLIAGLLLLIFADAVPAGAEDAGAPPQCWKPEALAGTPAEIKPQRNSKPLDLAALRQVVLSPVSPIGPELRGSIRGVELPPGEKLIALTFDLCEQNGFMSGYDGGIVDLLRAEGVKATFFAGGKWMETHAERAHQLLADPLFEIGGHGLRHMDLSRANDQTLKDEIVLTEAAYVRAKEGLAAKQCLIGTAAPAPQDQLTLFRFPYGTCNAKVLAATAEAGMLAVQWDVVTGDPDPHISAKTIANNILTKAHPGAIVVAHANGKGRNTAAALALALPKLKAEGYGFVTVSELIAAGKPVITPGCYLNKPGDAKYFPRMARVARIAPDASSTPGARSAASIRSARAPGRKVKHAPFSLYSPRH